MSGTRGTSDALSILHRRFYEGRPERLAALEKERVNGDVAEQVYHFRKAAGLTQRQLAELVGTQPSVICRLEDADYTGHSLSMLSRIAAALGKQVRVRFVAKTESGSRRGVCIRKGRRPQSRPETLLSRRKV